MSEVTVLKLARKSLWVYKVGPEGLGEFSETEWKKDNLEQLLRTIKVKFQTTKVRVILADEISYNLEFEWPDKKKKPDREEVKSELEGRVPDEIREDNWDYDLVEQDGGGWLVRVFVPIKEVFEVFMKTCKLVGLRVMLVIPEKFLGGGDDQMLKIAKMKISDKDEAFLGMTPEVEESILNKQINFGGEKKKEDFKKVEKDQDEDGGGTNKILVIGGIVVILVLGVLLWWLLQHKKQGKPKVYGPSPTPSPVTVVKKKEASPAATKPQKEASSSGKPRSKTAIDLSKYKVVIENGSGIAGEAGRVKEILQDEGFKNLKTKNADSFDYKETIVEVKKGVPEEVKQTINRALNDHYVLKIKDLQTEADYDVLVVVGKLFVQ